MKKHLMPFLKTHLIFISSKPIVPLWNKLSKFEQVTFYLAKVKPKEKTESSETWKAKVKPKNLLAREIRWFTHQCCRVTWTFQERVWGNILQFITVPSCILEGDEEERKSLKNKNKDAMLARYFLKLKKCSIVHNPIAVKS